MKLSDFDLSDFAHVRHVLDLHASDRSVIEDALRDNRAIRDVAERIAQPDPDPDVKYKAWDDATGDLRDSMKMRMGDQALRELEDVAYHFENVARQAGAEAENLSDVLNDLGEKVREDAKKQAPGGGYNCRCDFETNPRTYWDHTTGCKWQVPEPEPTGPLTVNEDPAYTTCHVLVEVGKRMVHSYSYVSHRDDLEDAPLIHCTVL